MSLNPSRRGFLGGALGLLTAAILPKIAWPMDDVDRFLWLVTHGKPIRFQKFTFNRAADVRGLHLDLLHCSFYLTQGETFFRGDETTTGSIVGCYFELPPQVLAWDYRPHSKYSLIAEPGRISAIEGGEWHEMESVT